MLNTLKNHWFSSVFVYAAARGSLLEASWSVLERPGAVLELSWSSDAAFDATEAASKLLRAALKRSWIDLKLLWSYFEELTLLGLLSRLDSIAKEKL